jgi:ACDE family multidrug resistance protein
LAESPHNTTESPAQLWLLSGSFFFLFLGVGAFQQFLVPTVAARAHCSDLAAALVFACVYFGGPLFLTVYGYVFQVLHERWSIVLGGLTYTLFAVILLLVPRYEVLLAAAFVFGFGAETLWATGPTQVINTAHHTRYGSVSGLFQSATYSGQMLGVLLLGVILGRYDDPQQGQAAMLVTAIGLGLVGNVLALFLRIKPKTRPPAKLSDAVQCIRSHAGRYLVLLSLANYLGWGLLLSSFTGLVQDIGQGGRLYWIVLPYYAGRLLVAWVAGHTSDKVGRERVMLVGFAVATAALVVAALWPTAGVIAAVSAAMGMQAAMVSVSSTAAVGDYVREEERHLIFAGTNAWGYLATGLTMVGSQLLRHTYGAFTPSLLLFAGFYAACGVLVVRMRAALQGEKAG